MISPKKVMVEVEKTSPGHKINWSNVDCTAVYNGKSILRESWGEVLSKRMTCIMGPSGSGKSSTLNFLSGRLTSNSTVKVDGKVLIDNKVYSPVNFKSAIGYVSQENFIHSLTTPRLALEFSVMMRFTQDKELTKKLVDGILESLELVECADTLIGSEAMKGISGGQRKRTMIGVELITKPKILFLDEPTSGLDSFSAFKCMEVIKNLLLNKEEEIIIIATIHQPSSQVFHLFDDIIFMRDGRTLYCGDLQGILPYFSRFGYHCPIIQSPDNFVMFLCCEEPYEKFIKSKIFMQCSFSSSLDNDDSNVTVLANEGHDISRILLADEMPAFYRDKVGKANFLTQVHELVKREVFLILRDRSQIRMRFVAPFIMSLLMSLVYSDVGTTNMANAQLRTTHSNAIKLIMVTSMIRSALPTIVKFVSERTIFLYEYSRGSYSILAYFIGTAIVEVILAFIQSVLQYALIYNIMALQGDFITLVFASVALCMATASLGILTGALIDDEKAVNECFPVIILPQLLYSGLFINLSDIHDFLRWAEYLCILKYGIDIGISTEFDPSLQSCQGKYAKYCQHEVDNVGSKNDLLWLYWIILILATPFVRFISGIVLKQRSRNSII